MRIIMGTGSRSMLTHPQAKEIYSDLEDYLLWYHEKEVGGIHLISGMAEGWDEAIAKVGMRNNIPYDVYIPTRNYGQYYWGDHSQQNVNRMAMFNTLVESARKAHYLEDIYGEPRFMRKGEVDKYTMAGPNYFMNGIWLHANMARNEEMVKISDLAVVYDAQSSGTRDAVTRLRQTRTAFEVYPFKKRLF